MVVAVVYLHFAVVVVVPAYVDTSDVVELVVAVG